MWIKLSLSQCLIWPSGVYVMSFTPMTVIDLGGRGHTLRSGPYSSSTLVWNNDTPPKLKFPQESRAGQPEFWCQWEGTFCGSMRFWQFVLHPYWTDYNGSITGRTTPDQDCLLMLLACYLNLNIMSESWKTDLGGGYNGPFLLVPLLSTWPFWINLLSLLFRVIYL